MSEQEAGNDKLEIDNMFLCGSKLTRVNLSNTRFQDMVGQEMSFDDVNLTGTRINNANLSELVLTDVNMANAEISNANLSGLAISRANIAEMTIDGILVTDLIDAYDAQKG